MVIAVAPREANAKKFAPKNAIVARKIALRKTANRKIASALRSKPSVIRFPLTGQVSLMVYPDHGLYFR